MVSHRVISIRRIVEDLYGSDDPPDTLISTVVSEIETHFERLWDTAVEGAKDGLNPIIAEERERGVDIRPNVLLGKSGREELVVQVHPVIVCIHRNAHPAHISQRLLDYTHEAAEEAAKRVRAEVRQIAEEVVKRYKLEEEERRKAVRERV